MKAFVPIFAFLLLAACKEKISRYDSSLRDDISGVWVYPAEQTGVTTIMVTDGITWKSHEFNSKKIDTSRGTQWHDHGEVLGQEKTYYFSNDENFYSPDFLIKTPTGKDVFIRSRHSYDTYKETGKIPYGVIIRVASELDPDSPPERPSIETLGLPYGR